MKSYLLSTDRHIYTNLPVYPDIIANQLVKVESNNPINKHDDMIKYLKRIHIIRRFPTFDELRDFRKKKSPIWCSLYQCRDRRTDFERLEDGKPKLDDNGDKIIPFNPDRLFFPLECIFEFWKYKRYNSVIMLEF